MKKWPALQNGDLVDIVAPGYAVDAELVVKAQAALESFGFRTRVPVDLINPDGFHSNSDKTRLIHLKAALLAKDSKAIWCMRGGYGSNRLLPMLAKIKKPQHAKLLIGISDITSLHLFLNQKWQWSTLHASLLDRIAKNKLPEEVLAELLSVIRGQKKSLAFLGLECLNPAAKKKTKLKSEIVGGNLTVLQGQLGTPWSPRLKGRLLFLEDTGERGYRVDRILEHFVQAGVLKDCTGILFGQFIGGAEPEGTKHAGVDRCREAIERFAALHPRLPMWAGVESGHDVRLRTLPLGTPAKIETQSGSVILTVETGAQ